MDRFLDHFRYKSEAESKWLQEIFSFISQHLFPLVSKFTGPAADTCVTGGGVCCQDLAMCVVTKIEENMCVSHTLPVSYRLVSISELVSQQHLPCVSRLSWSTSQQRAWLKEAERSPPGHQPLQRVNLLLTGCLEEGQAGGWRVTDTSGSVRCEGVSFSPLWLHHPVLFPNWNYIPYSGSEQEQKGAGGHVELIGSPVLLRPAPEQRMDLTRAVGVREAAGYLSSSPRGRRLSVCGHVASVCALLRVAGTSFFCFSLTDDTHRLPVLVKESSRLWWSDCLCVGDRVCVTSLRVCALRGWKGNSILAVTDHSEIHTNYSQGPREDSRADPQGDTPPSLVMSCIDDDDTEESQRMFTRTKQSRIINYQGTVTEVVSAGAGLYVMDGKVGLCLAYQPPLRRELRAGDSVQITHVHFLFRPSPDFPPSILCTCLRSTLKISSFSKVSGPPAGSSCPCDGVLPRLLLEKNMGICEYLWVCHLSSQLSHSVDPAVSPVSLQYSVDPAVSPVSPVSLHSVDPAVSPVSLQYSVDPAVSPVSLQYRVDPACPQYVSVSELCQSLLDCWSSVSLESLLPDGGSSLTRSQINTMLSWSFNVQTGSRLRRRPLLLVGILELPSKTSELTLQLRDGTAAVACVATETNHGEDEGQKTTCNTAWIGCLVCVLEFMVVTERFIQSDFPSFQHLDQEKYITHKNCRVYLQFSVDHVHILSPSVAMETHLHQKGRDLTADVSGKTERMQEGEIGGQKKRKLEEEPTVPPWVPSAAVATGPVSGWQCVSMVIRVEHKEGVSWRNAGLNEADVGLVLCFSAKAAVMGPVVTWRQDPQNRPMSEKETTTESKVLLVFSGLTVRWFPVIQPGSFYRLVATNSQDPCVLIGSAVSAQSGVELHADSTLQVQPDWRFHTLTKSLLLPAFRQAPSTRVLSVSEVLECSCDLVCFQALLIDRISVNDGFNDSGDKNKGVRLTVCDQSGRSLRVYLDLTHTPYPLGLLPGNTLLFSEFQRRVSRAGSVYCSYLPVSSITVVSLGDSSPNQPPPAPIMHLGVWAGSTGPSFIVGQVKGHVVCVLFVRLQWICSLCGGLYRQCPCVFVDGVRVSLLTVSMCLCVFVDSVHVSVCPPVCVSTCLCVHVSSAAVLCLPLSLFQSSCAAPAHRFFSPKQITTAGSTIMNCGPVHTRQMVNTPHDWWGVFTMTTVLLLWSYSRLVLDDGTGEAHVWVSGALVRPLLGLNDRQWEGLQRALRVRGQVEVYPWGQSLVCADALLHFLLCVCSSKVVCRQLALTCRRHNRQRSEESKRFSRGDRDFLTRLTPPLQLTCLHINTP
ncbi:CST complex subunit CTC1 [Takifugu flavidus]|uniref:CST complex subunit CTC1 n=1 Tax=Takifugu flavidus TaxID=433684 RepID=A0A5C6N9Y4_9TELE|nr:CST complex subunit CTC1 [Takifugu flavidus]